MIKILKNKQIKNIDKYTVECEPIKSVDLMQRAATQLFNKIIGLFPKQKFLIFAGPGNNGGDAVVIYLLMIKHRINARLIFVNDSDTFSPDCQYFINSLNILNLPVKHWKTESDIWEIDKNRIIIDGIFGSGLTRCVSGFYADVINHINSSPNIKVSIDIPSGLFDEDNSANSGAIINANFTLSLQFPKLDFLFPENEKFVGEWFLIDINLHKDAILQENTTNYYLETNDIKEKIISRKRFSHKGTFGHALIVAGNKGKFGAMVLSAKSCLRSGAGLVSVFNRNQEAETILNISIPEVMFLKNRHSNFENFTAIGIGPGIGLDFEGQDLFEHTLNNTNRPMVIDADALNILSTRKELLKKIPKNSILTPHLVEFERLVGKCSNSYERLEKAKVFSEQYNIIIVLKGANTAIVTPDGTVYFNSTGNSGMATAGSGDVLTGILTGLLSTGYSPVDAAIIGVYMHGLAGDLALARQSSESLIASDIVDNLGRTFNLINMG